MGNRTLKTQTGKGMAMVMMLILVPILMFLAMSFVDPIVRSFRSAVNDQKTLLAKNVADSMFEIALWDSRGAGVGENVKNEDWPQPIEREYDFGTATVRWSVMATPDISDDKLIEVVSGDKYYTIPSPGSGTAGDDYCSTSEPVVDGDSLTETLGELGIEPGDLGGTNYDAFSWPCNWNKLREGESVVIPLYTEDENGVVHPFWTSGSTFELRIRPPCDTDKVTSREDEYESEICSEGERYTLKGDAGLAEKTVLVLWEITGKQVDENGDDVVLEPFDQDQFIRDSLFTVGVFNKDGSKFFEYLSENSFTDSWARIGTELQNMYKPTLRIMAVHQLRDSSDRTVPYLEYQFKAPINIGTDKPISNTSKVVHVEVMIDGGYSTSIDKIVGIAKSVSGFVIQQ
jgi:hypothetical protein